ncbi:Alpha,alpha-trehalose-phosphate synthase [UDP-forming] 5 [Dendrobium catenatum]|uniref:Alpha,alpha-trehalose-phosphate synthase [UDP-forming] 5 n=1 Tax=Dendrobium catenatum TaxID=906689 RepID=A0A2I0VLV1_9ASPA|nr:Alpha,alpha-trehalose-phosphate synthase [UDP-forming] 5 [Dendrobium catenatum]
MMLSCPWTAQNHNATSLPQLASKTVSRPDFATASATSRDPTHLPSSGPSDPPTSPSPPALDSLLLQLAIGPDAEIDAAEEGLDLRRQQTENPLCSRDLAPGVEHDLSQANPSSPSSCSYSDSIVDLDTSSRPKPHSHLTHLLPKISIPRALNLKSNIQPDSAIGTRLVTSSSGNHLKQVSPEEIEDAHNEEWNVQKPLHHNQLPLRAHRSSDNSGWNFSWDEDSLLLQLKDGLGEDVEVVYIGCLREEIDSKDQDDVSQTLLETFKCFPTLLPPELFSRFYHGSCKQQLWPLFHYMLPFSPDLGGRFDRSLWQAYVSVNKIFADKVMEVINPEEDFVWVHGYHLMILPTFLRKRHFLSCCTRMIGLFYQSKKGYVGIEYYGCPVSIKILPVGVHERQLQYIQDLPEIEAKVVELLNQFKGRTVLLGVDDLEDTPNILISNMHKVLFITEAINSNRLQDVQVVVLHVQRLGSRNARAGQLLISTYGGMENCGRKNAENRRFFPAVSVDLPAVLADRTSGGDDRASDREREGKSENEMSGARGLVLGLLPAVFRWSRPPYQNHLSPAVWTAGKPPVHIDIRRFTGGL